MHMKIVNESSKGQQSVGTDHGIWMIQTLGVLPVPLPGELIEVYGAWYVVNRREWLATSRDLHVLLYVSPKPEGI